MSITSDLSAGHVDDYLTPVTTIASRVRDRSVRSPSATALREKDFGLWQEITWHDFWRWIERVANGLLALGVQPGDRVAIHAENRCEWLYCDHAIVAVRGITVGLYPTNPAAEVRHVLGDSGANVLFAEDQEQVDKVLEVVDELPELQHIVYLEPRGIHGQYTHPKLLYWNDLLALGDEYQAANESQLSERMASANSDDIMTLVYTSGTTGPPKGAMLSVANVEFAIRILIQEGGFVWPPATERDTMVCHLPLCHVAERVTAWFNAAAGVQLNFVESIDTVQQALTEVQPTILQGVPRIWEKFLAAVDIRMASASRLKRWNYRLWMRLAERVGDRVAQRGGVWTVGDRLRWFPGWLFLYRALRKRLGMSQVRHAITGAAPIAPEVLATFISLGLPLHEVYGMTENTAVATAHKPGRIRLGTVGEPYEGVEVRIDEVTGEILTRHPANFVGYWNQIELTREVLDDDGWLHTGDVGEWIDGSYLKITDRMKDIIITAGGKNISPSEIENSLKASTFIKEAVVIGDGRKYVTALIGIEYDTVGDWALREQIPYTTYRDLSEKPETVELVRSIVRKTNERFARVEQVKKFRMLPKELDHEDGELTATQKVKRSVLEEMFRDLVESMYSGSDAGVGGDV